MNWAQIFAGAAVGMIVVFVLMAIAVGSKKNAISQEYREAQKRTEELLTSANLHRDRIASALDARSAPSDRDRLVGQILAGFCANPAIFAPNPSCGWGLVNCDESQLVAYAGRLADKALDESKSRESLVKIDHEEAAS